MADNATILMSGGLDSTVCAHLVRAQGLSVMGLFVDFGQRAAAQERVALGAIGRVLALPVRTIQLRGAGIYGSGEVVGRNAFLVLTALLVGGGRTGPIVLGVHSGTPYYDCSVQFVRGLSKLVVEQTDGRVSVLSPLLTWTKQDIHVYANQHNVPISLTYSCETGTEIPCGKCASCQDRSALGC